MKTDSLSDSESRALRLAVKVVLAFAEGATPAEAFAVENKADPAATFLASPSAQKTEH